MEDQHLSPIIRKAYWRLLPILLIGYLLAYLDRMNIGFAALQMNKDLGLNSYTYGFAAGVFFWGYVLLEIPSNMVMEKVGARLWISRIMISWGILAAATAFVQGPTSLYWMRFLLGSAEAGFYPGVILYITYWFPQRYKAFTFALFNLALPMSLGVGAPVATAILQLDGALGFRGWQWLFLLEGIPTALFGVVFLLTIPNKPKQAKWLAKDEQDRLQSVLDSERSTVAAHSSHGAAWFKALLDPRVLILAVIYFVDTGTNLGLSFFLPQMVKNMGVAGMNIGWVTAIPYVFGMIGVLVFGYVSDRRRNRKWAVITALLFIGVGMLGAAACKSVGPMIAMMSIAAIGIYGLKAPFWALPSFFLVGQAAAVGIAFINAFGNMGGFFGPYAIGWIHHSTGSFESGLYMLGVVGLCTALFTLFFVHLEKNAKAAQITN